MNEDMQRAKAVAKGDQAWIEMEDLLPDIKRIITTGPTNSRDLLIVKAVFSLVLGEIMVRRFDRQRQEDDG